MPTQIQARTFLSATTESSETIDSTEPSDGAAVDDSAPSPEKESLLEILREFSETDPSPFLADKSKKQKFKDAVSLLENSSRRVPTPSAIVGKWKLLCTTNTATTPTPLTKIGKAPPALRGDLEVFQNVKTDGGAYDADGTISRIDNVLVLRPPAERDGDVLSKIAGALNPLGLTTAKITLIHEAHVEAVAPPVTRTRIDFKSVVLTVAGRSSVLPADPGEDVFGLNIPSLGGLANAGKFDTTYVDDDLRVSRGVVDFLDELRVFVRVEE